MFQPGLINDYGQDNWIFLAWMDNLSIYKKLTFPFSGNKPSCFFQQVYFFPFPTPEDLYKQRQKCNHDTNTKDNINSQHAQQADTLARQSFNK